MKKGLVLALMLVLAISTIAFAESEKHIGLHVKVEEYIQVNVVGRVELDINNPASSVQSTKPATVSWKTNTGIDADVHVQKGLPGVLGDAVKIQFVNDRTNRTFELPAITGKEFDFPNAPLESLNSLNLRSGSLTVTAVYDPEGHDWTAINAKEYNGTIVITYSALSD